MGDSGPSWPFLYLFVLAAGGRLQHIIGIMILVVWNAA